MIKNKKIIVTTLCALICIFYTSVYAVRLLTKKVALQQMLPDAEQVVEEKITLTPEQKEAIKEKLGGILVYYQADSEAEKESVYESDEYIFYFGMKGGQKTGVAMIETQPGKWGPVEYIVALDATNAKVTNLAVMSYMERRGRPIARRNFLKQFINKGHTDRLKVGKDIRSITGATISCVATCFAVKKVSIMYNVLFLMTKVSETEKK